MENHKIRDYNIALFKQRYPALRGLTNPQILLIFKRYKEYTQRHFEVHHHGLYMVGSFIVLFAHLFINITIPGLMGNVKKTKIEIIYNCLISSFTSALTITMIAKYKNIVWSDEKMLLIKQQNLQIYCYDIKEVCNGMIAGLVSVTAVAYNVEEWAAAIIGIIGCIIYKNTKLVLARFEIDDPLDTVEVHGFCAIWSLLAVGIFDNNSGGLFTGSFSQLGIQFFCMFGFVFWSVLISFIFYYSLFKANRLRVDQLYEIMGLDYVIKHNETSIDNNILQEEELLETTH